MNNFGGLVGEVAAVEFVQFHCGCRGTEVFSLIQLCNMLFIVIVCFLELFVWRDVLCPWGIIKYFFLFPAGHVYSSAKLCLLLKFSTFLEYVWWDCFSIVDGSYILVYIILVYKGR